MTNTPCRPPPALDPIEHLLVLEQVVADVLHRLELAIRPLLGDEHARVVALERVEVVDVEEVAQPAVDAEQVERGRRDEVDRRLVGAEERADLGDPAEPCRRLGQVQPSSRIYGRPPAGRIARPVGVSRTTRSARAPTRRRCRPPSGSPRRRRRRPGRARPPRCAPRAAARPRSSRRLGRPGAGDEPGSSTLTSTVGRPGRGRRPRPPAGHLADPEVADVVHEQASDPVSAARRTPPRRPVAAQPDLRVGGRPGGPRRSGGG